MNFKITTYTLLLCLLNFSFVNAQTNWVHYTPADGLVQTQVEAVFQDSRGYIWVGTKSGISRFNGFEFENFEHADELIGRTIIKFLEYEEGVIWALATEGVFKIEDDNIELYQTNDPNTFLENMAYADGHLYIASRMSAGNEYTSLYKLADGFLMPIQLPKQIDTHGTYVVSANNQLYVNIVYYDILNLLNRHNIYRYSKKGVFEPVVEYSFKLPDFLLTFPNKREKPDKELRILVNTFQQEFYYKDDKDTIYTLLDGLINTGNTLRGKILWRDADYNFIEQRGDSIFWKPIGKKAEHITTLPEVKVAMRDLHENIWLGSESGLYRISPFDNFGIENGLQPVVWSIVEYPKGSVWLFSFNRGNKAKDNVRVFNYRTKKIERAPDNVSQAITAHSKQYGGGLDFYMGSRVLSDDKMYIATRRGCAVYDGLNYKVIEDVIREQIFYVYEDTTAQKVFIASSIGLYLFDFFDKKLRLEKYIERFIHQDLRIALCMVRGADDYMYIGTGRGLARYDYDSIYFMHKDTMPYAGVRSIQKDYKGNLWLGSENGLWHYDYKSFTRLRHHGLMRQVSALCEVTPTSMLAGSPAGVALIDLEAYYRGVSEPISFYDETSGYLGGEVGQNGITKDSYGNVWIAGKNCVSRFNYSDLSQNLKAPKVYIEKAKYINKSGEEVKMRHRNAILKYGANNLHFSFSAISYGTPGQVRFKYQLENYDKNQSHVSAQRYVNYENISPGNYTFKVWAVNERGVWSTEPASISFRRVPALCEMLGFMVFTILLSAIVLVWLTLFFYKRYKKSKENMRQLAELQMQTLTGQLYPHFLFNAVTNIGNAIYQEKRDEAYNYTAKLTRLVRIVHESRKRTALKISDEILFVKLYLDIQKYRFGKRFDFEIDIGNNVKINKLIPQMLIQNFVENAVKHGLEPLKEGGLLLIKITQNQKHIKIIVQDNGVGMKASQKKKRLLDSRSGTKLTEQMLELFNKYYDTKISFTTHDLYERGKQGTKVEIIVPL